MNFPQVIQRLKSDWGFVSNFLTNPETALAGANLAPAERQALLSRDAKALLSLGVNGEQAVSALSGCHRNPSVRVPTTHVNRAAVAA